MSNGAGYSKKHLEQNDYYADGEKVTGQWFGKGAERLRLQGEVSAEQFEAVREGVHPDTGEKLRPRQSVDRIAKDGSTQSTGRSLYDFTFSAPKSVSIMAIVGGDDRLIEAHNQAVQEALVEMERCAATRVRQGGQNTDRVTGNLVAACYWHDTSRRLDPQLHTHVVAANLTYDPVEERWKALQATGLYQRRAFFTEFYRNTLAQKIQELGFEIENRTSAKGRDLGFEIKGVPREMIEEFSQGSSEREKAVAEFVQKTGRAPSDNEIAVLVRDSRPDKLLSISTEEVRAGQLARLSEEQQRQLATLRERAEQNRPVIKTHDANLSLQYALDHVFERVSVANDFTVKAEALRHGRGHLQLEELNSLLRELEAKGEIIRAGSEIATRQSLEREREMIEIINDGQGKFDRLGNQAKNYQVPDHLNAEQRNVIEFVLNSRDRAVNVEGAAGTGKTATLRELRHGLQAGGRHMIAIAPTHSAADELKKVGFLNAMTIERLLQDCEVHPHLQERAVIVDEAGMVSGRQMQELLRLSKRFDARLVFCGDTKQIQSVEASDALRILQKESCLATSSLREVQRQRNQDYKTAIKALRADPETGFALLDRMGAVKEADLMERGKTVAEAYRQASGSTLVVCPTHEEIRRVTEAIRADRLRQGDLTGNRALERLEPLNWTHAQKCDLNIFIPGQVLVFHKGTRHAHKHDSFTVLGQDGQRLIAQDGEGKQIKLTGKQAKCFSVFARRDIDVAVGDRLAIEANVRGQSFKFTNGELVTVAGIDAHGHVMLADGRPLPHNFRQFNHGYAVTAHKSQGKTVDHVIISGDAMTRELFYVAASRGRHGIEVFTGDKEFLRATIEVSGQRQSALELLRKSARTVDRSRFAERPRPLMARIGAALEKAWRNIPGIILGPKFAPEREPVLDLHK